MAYCGEEGWGSIGGMSHFPEGKLIEIGYTLIQGERGKGYCTEAVKFMINYLVSFKKHSTCSSSNRPRKHSFPKSSRKQDSRRRQSFANQIFKEENGEIELFIVFLEKNGKNQRYLRKQLRVNPLISQAIEVFGQFEIEL